MIGEYDAIKPLFDAVSYTPVGFGKPINDRLAEHPDGRKWLRRQAQSAWRSSATISRTIIAAASCCGWRSRP